jgi:hypothetical protein
MYTEEANEIYKKMCKKFHRDEGNITHSNTFLFSCLNEALNSVKKNVVLDNVVGSTNLTDNLIEFCRYLDDNDKLKHAFDKLTPEQVVLLYIKDK